MDEEDSMDGTEITESIGPQDTGEALLRGVGAFGAAMVVFPSLSPSIVPPAFQTGIEVQWERAQG